VIVFKAGSAEDTWAWTAFFEADIGDGVVMLMAGSNLALHI